MTQQIEGLKCGDFHCQTYLNIGCILEWGSNDEGQLGNRKRAFSENPIWMKTFENENVKGIYAGESSSCVICEWGPADQKKLDKKTASE